MKRSATHSFDDLEMEFMRHGWPKPMKMPSRTTETFPDRRLARTVCGGIGGGLVGLGKWIESRA